jgi:oligoendopeptidase F
MTVDFDGQEKTMSQMAKLLEEPDRSLRESAWRAVCDRRLEDAHKFEDVFDKMLSLRVQIAKNAGFDNYRDYKFKEYHRFDYTPDDCKNYHRAVEKMVVPVLKKLSQRRAKQMQLSSLRPWDAKADPKGREPLKPFETIEEYKKGISEIFGNIDADFKTQFDEMDKLGLLDLASRKGKASFDGYQCDLSEARKAFIFLKAVGVDTDILALTHEGGHAFHFLASANEPLLPYRQAPKEFSEVASLSMELFAMTYYNVFYDTEDAQRSKFNLLERVVNILAVAAMFDSFQHWIYENPEHSNANRAEQWVKLHELYYGQFEDWSGLKKERQFLWHRVAPLFQCPFYIIEFGIAFLGALSLWMQFKNDKSATIANYKKALALGGSRPLPQLFETAGLKFDFSEETIAPLMEIVVKELSL